MSYASARVHNRSISSKLTEDTVLDKNFSFYKNGSHHKRWAVKHFESFEPPDRHSSVSIHRESQHLREAKEIFAELYLRPAPTP